MIIHQLSSAPATRPASPTKPPQAPRSSGSRLWTRTWAATLTSATLCTQVSSRGTLFIFYELLFLHHPDLHSVRGELYPLEAAAMVLMFTYTSFPVQPQPAIADSLAPLRQRV